MNENLEGDKYSSFDVILLEPTEKWSAMGMLQYLENQKEFGRKILIKPSKINGRRRIGGMERGSSQNTNSFKPDGDDY